MYIYTIQCSLTGYWLIHHLVHAELWPKYVVEFI
jgi:hypothetical protein